MSNYKLVYKCAESRPGQSNAKEKFRVSESEKHLTKQELCCDLSTFEASGLSDKINEVCLE